MQPAWNLANRRIVLPFLSIWFLVACSQGSAQVAEITNESVNTTSTTEVPQTTIPIDEEKVADFDAKIEQARKNLVAVKEQSEIQLNVLTSDFKKKLNSYGNELACTHKLTTAGVLNDVSWSSDRVNSKTADELNAVAKSVIASPIGEWGCFSPQDRETAFGYPGWSVEAFYSRFRSGYEGIWDQFISPLIVKAAEFQSKTSLSSCQECISLRDQFEQSWIIQRDKRINQARALCGNFITELDAVRRRIAKAENDLTSLVTNRSEYIRTIEIANRPKSDGSSSGTSSGTANESSGGSSNSRPAGCDRAERASFIISDYYYFENDHSFAELNSALNTIANLLEANGYGLEARAIDTASSLGDAIFIYSNLLSQICR